MLDGHLAQSEKVAWLITDGKAGMDMPCLGVAEALGFDSQFKHISLSGPWRWMAPWGPVPPKFAPQKPQSVFQPPWPDLAIATGRMSIPYLQALRKAVGEQLVSVIIQDPRIGTKGADLIFVPEHDRLRGENVIATPTAPHIFSPQKLQQMREQPFEALDNLAEPRIAVILGGPNSVYKYTDNALLRFSKSLSALARLGVSFMITPSRRTPMALIQAVEKAVQSTSYFIWDGKGENPYPYILARADYLIVTGDSVNMTSEACATGRPVYTFMPEGGSRKFEAFHNRLRTFGATKNLPERITELEDWTYDASKLDAASIIAAEIRKYMMG